MPNCTQGRTHALDLLMLKARKSGSQALSLFFFFLGLAVRLRDRTTLPPFYFGQSGPRSAAAHALNFSAAAAAGEGAQGPEGPSLSL